MESGFARQLFIRWCSDPNNSVIITSRTAEGTLARSLIDDPKLKSITLKVGMIVFMLVYLFSRRRTASDAYYWMIRALFIAVTTSCLKESEPA